MSYILTSTQSSLQTLTPLEVSPIILSNGTSSTNSTATFTIPYNSNYIYFVSVFDNNNKFYPLTQTISNSLVTYSAVVTVSPTLNYTINAYAGLLLVQSISPSLFTYNTTLGTTIKNLQLSISNGAIVISFIPGNNMTYIINVIDSNGNSYDNNSNNKLIQQMSSTDSTKNYYQFTFLTNVPLYYTLNISANLNANLNAITSISVPTHYECTNLAISNVNGTNVTISFNLPINISTISGIPITYQLVSTPSIESQTQPMSLSNSEQSLTISGLSYNTSYVFNVLTLFGTQRCMSLSTSPILMSAPNLITNLSLLSNGSGSINVSFNYTNYIQNTNYTQNTTLPPISCFEIIYYSGEIYKIIQIPPTQTSLTISGLQVGILYNFSVGAINGVGRGGSVTSSIIVGTPPNPPTISSITYIGNSTISFKLIAPSSNFSPITSYTIKSTDGSISYKSDTSATTITISISNNNNDVYKYNFYALATNSCGNSTNSPISPFIYIRNGTMIFHSNIRQTGDGVDNTSDNAILLVDKPSIISASGNIVYTDPLFASIYSNYNITISYVNTGDTGLSHINTLKNVNGQPNNFSIPISRLNNSSFVYYWNMGGTTFYANVGGSASLFATINC